MAGQQGEAFQADVAFHPTMPVDLGLLLGQIQPEEAIADGRIRIEGDPGALHRFLTICGGRSSDVNSS